MARYEIEVVSVTTIRETTWVDVEADDTETAMDLARAQMVKLPADAWEQESESVRYAYTVYADGGEVDSDEDEDGGRC